ncbi:MULTISPECIES: hydrogen peroxide-inducible genes activator [Gemmobacter]|jgi:LysR family hydrogen peroxide-inducible transcriptional activator|uniref:LysR family transcriptional regulator n=2 Tax=Gemmobacter TaxID=204456 RepID=A0A2T6B005_9RHOB|nr:MULTISPECIES: hydrogen peroxide-inducible genes activator [Gemmobacter]OJY28313.1 MAG: LysR family transcriptional regulator [Rhodobacterales bacterium 65-51]PTX49396.1 LysR family transcriptional regulator [Gemmobacter caeni]TWJ00307.1 LysR family hydrogen peroxide-inducible transcriptional activator [Gemmobacter caeni]GHC19576.1 LysR family transcriptional regulator [Gemmobacter nanjingensis]
MKGLTLKQIRYFEALARHRTFGRAAEACAVTQPALSMQIKELEEMAGTPLLERGPRQIRLTAFGEMFLTRAQAMLAIVDDLDDLARAAGGQPAGKLRLGVIPTIAPYLLPAVITRLSQQFPGLMPILRETMTSRLIEELNDGRIDAAILALPVSEPALTEVSLFTERFVLIRQIADADRPVPSRDMLREMRLLLLEEGHCFRDQALSFCDMPSTQPREMLDGSSLSTLVQMVGVGIGVTLIPEMAVPIETRSAAVSVARFRDPQPVRTIGMVWRRSSGMEAQLLQIAEVVRHCGMTLRQASGLTTLPGWRR